MLFVNFWDNVSKKNTKEKYTVERRQMRANARGWRSQPFAGRWFEGKIGEKHMVRREEENAEPASRGGMEGRYKEFIRK